MSFGWLLLNASWLHHKNSLKTGCNVSIYLYKYILKEGMIDPVDPS